MDKYLELLLSNPEVAKGIISEYVGKYKPVLYSVVDELLNIYKDFANNEEYFNTVAKSRKNQFDAYVAIGFSESQAMTLLVSDINKLAEQIKNTSKNIKSK